MVNSKQKGSRGEREAAEYLRGLGFASARRTQQYNGDGKSDVVADELPHVHIEVKYGYASGFDIGSAKWQDACDQAYRDSGEHPNWCVLWRKKGDNIWKLSLFSFALNCIVTVAGDAAITNCLRRLNLEGPKLDSERLTPLAERGGK